MEAPTSPLSPDRSEAPRRDLRCAPSAFPNLNPYKQPCRRKRPSASTRQINGKPLIFVTPLLSQPEPSAREQIHDPFIAKFITILGVNRLASLKPHRHIQPA